MASEMMEALKLLCQEKHINESFLIDRLEKSLAESYTKVLNLDYGSQVTIDRTSGKVYVYALVPKGMTRAEDGYYDGEYEGEEDPETGEPLEFEKVDVTPPDTSRTAAMHAKNEIRDLVRTAAREQIYEEFADRVGDLITGTVLQVTPDFTIVKIRDGVEAELPHFDSRRHPDERNERPQGEHYVHNQRIQAIIIDVRNPNNPNTPVRGERTRPPIVISRRDPEFLRRLFEKEVPEVYDGLVEVRSIAREAGVRSKVAVYSNDERLDPVGACVGPRGSRVRAVVSELRGERVDVIPWSDDPAQRVAAALSPAKVSRVILSEEDGHNYATVIVPDEELSLAIGKEGQNARLAALLTGFHIDIKNEQLAADILRNLPQLEVEDEEDLEGLRCEYVSPEGIQCRNMARPGSHYCGIHEKMEEIDDSLV